MNAAAPRALGRYEVVGALARGGMGTVYLARHTGEAGFQRLYAVKVLHPHLADEPQFVVMLLDEARIASRLHHPNVVPIVDHGSESGVNYVVMEYVEGCTLSALLSKYRNIRPARFLVPLFLDMLAGLHAAHSLVDDDGKPMHLVHRDVSPQNVLVGVDGVGRLTDFGVAKAESLIHSTRPGELKGKLAFMSPEQVKQSSGVDRRSDIFSTGAMLWSALTGRKLFMGANDGETVNNILSGTIPPPSAVGLQPPAALDLVVMKALERDPAQRYATAAEMEEALRDVATKNDLSAARREVVEWVSSAFGPELAGRRAAIRAAAAMPPRRDAGASGSVSALRVIPAIGTNELPELTVGTPSGQRADLPAEASAETLARVPSSPRPKGRWRTPFAIGAALLLLGGGAIVVRGRLATMARAPAPAPTNAQANAEIAPVPAPAATPAVPSVASAAKDPATVAAVSSSPPARPPPLAKPPRPSPAPVAAKAPQSPPQTSPPSTSTPDPKRKPAAWDNDSPLPPP